MNFRPEILKISAEILYSNNFLQNSTMCMFIDRSPAHFDSILNFMRDGEIDFPDAILECRRLRREAVYYELEELVKNCDVEIAKREANINAKNSEDVSS